MEQTIQEQYFEKNRCQWLRMEKKPFVLIKGQRAIGFYDRIVEAKNVSMQILRREEQRGDIGAFVHADMLIADIRKIKD